MQKKARGFSLIELIVVITTLSLIAAIGSQIFGAGLDSYYEGKDIIDADWQGRVAMTRINRELHEIRSAADITITPGTEIQFINRNDTLVRFWLNGTTLMRNSQPLADGITGLNFSYLQADGKTAATLATEVYYVVMNFSVIKNGVNFPLRVVIHPRTIV